MPIEKGKLYRLKVECKEDGAHISIVDVPDFADVLFYEEFKGLVMTKNGIALTLQNGNLVLLDHTLDEAGEIMNKIYQKQAENKAGSTE